MDFDMRYAKIGAVALAILVFLGLAGLMVADRLALPPAPDPAGPEKLIEGQ